jgi:hypothetical protein
MPGRPITALLDTVAVGGGDPATRSVWDVHVARMAERAARARPPEPDLRLSARDPYALRYIAATAFAMALLFGTLGRVAEVREAVTLGPGAAAASGPSWEGWVEPPIYTGLPSLYLNDIDRRVLRGAGRQPHQPALLWRAGRDHRRDHRSA